MSDKNELDQYYTDELIAKRLSDIVKSLYSSSHYVEPSAGTGAFSRNFVGITSYDLDPKFEGCIQADFMELDIERHRGDVFVGNPPFGKNSSLALKFLNKSGSVAKAVCFILPLTFKKIFFQQRVDNNLHLVYEEVLGKKSFILDGKPYDVPCVFQVWERLGEPRLDIEVRNIYLKEVVKQEAEFALRRVGGKAGKILEGLDHSESSTYFFKELKPGVKDVLKQLQSELVKQSQYTAGVRSISKNEINYFLSRHFDNQ